MIPALQSRDPLSVLALLRSGGRAPSRGEVGSGQGGLDVGDRSAGQALRELQTLQHALRQLERMEPLLGPIA